MQASGSAVITWPMRAWAQKYTKLPLVAVLFPGAEELFKPRVAAVRGGLLSLDDACSRYTLTVDEFLSWQLSIDQYGLAGLRTTRLQQYRP